MLAQEPELGPVRVLVRDSTIMGTQLLAAAIGRERRFAVQAIGDLENISELQLPADVAVASTDLDGKPQGGFELARRLRALCPKLQIIMLLDASTPDLVIHAFKAGAKGLICRNESFRAVSKCIRAVHRGQVWASHEQLRIVLDAFCDGSPLPLPIQAELRTLLSNREQDVVRYVAKGLSNREIAKQLNLSEHTIKGHLFRIFEKLGLSSRVEVVLYACSQNQSNQAIPRPPVAERQQPQRASGDRTLNESLALAFAARNRSQK